MMVEVKQTEIFRLWLASLKDARARARIQVRIDRLSLGNPGQVRDVGHGISELKIDYGPGYRVYYLQTGLMVVLLLCGGDKGSQDKDIKAAKRIAAGVRG